MTMNDGPSLEVFWQGLPARLIIGITMLFMGMQLKKQSEEFRELKQNNELNRNEAFIKTYASIIQKELLTDCVKINPKQWERR